MNRRALKHGDPTAQARIDAAKRKIAEGIDELVDARLSLGNSLSEWVNQDNSPLGRDRHLRLCRKGVLPCTRDGRKRLVRRVDLDAYLDGNTVTPAPSAEDDVSAMMRKITGSRK